MIPATLSDADLTTILDGSASERMELVARIRGPQPSSEPKWLTVFDGSDRDYRLISMFELQELEYAINESEPGHFKEMHDSGNAVIKKVRARNQQPMEHRPPGLCPHGIEWQGEVLCHNTDECPYQRPSVGPVPFVVCTREAVALAAAEAAEESGRLK